MNSFPMAAVSKQHKFIFLHFWASKVRVYRLKIKVLIGRIPAHGSWREPIFCPFQLLWLHHCYCHFPPSIPLFFPDFSTLPLLRTFVITFMPGSSPNPQHFNLILYHVRIHPQVPRFRD